MRYGPIVAKRWKKQYFKRGKWQTIDFWNYQPEEYYHVLLELESKKAIEMILNKSWVQYLPRERNAAHLASQAKNEE